MNSRPAALINPLWSVAIALATLFLTSCSDDSTQPAKGSLSEALTNALPTDASATEILSSTNPERVVVAETWSDPPMVRARDKAVSARSRDAGVRAYGVWDNRASVLAQPDLPTITVQEILYEAPDEVGATSLWEQEPPELVHETPSNADMSVDEIRDKAALWRAPNPVTDNRFAWKNICLSSPYRMTAATRCDGFYGWTVFCRYVLEVRITVVDEPVDSRWIPLVMARLAEQAAQNVRC